MQFMLLIYIDPKLQDALPAAEADTMMRECFAHTDRMAQAGIVLQSQQLESAATAKSVRIRNGRTSTTDGPYSETKELLGGFNLIEADSMEEAVRIATEELPWASLGCVEVRPVRDIAEVRRQVGHPARA